MFIKSAKIYNLVKLIVFSPLLVFLSQYYVSFIMLVSKCNNKGIENGYNSKECYKNK